ncbi:hypothetical protein [Saccharopolyspora sp. 6M]|uniref:hypothetical protein n=1 Tax=Saccharopolyspora sp. 6M TaxID=2877237 RepID=UPI001CD3B0E0|nr:hypothetical protein [Saccharopolyspora sp. 6M]MCA1226665.1 hypothetical protein [Saccharopolyspora sp. 6M]
MAENAATLDGGDLDASDSGHALGLDQAEQNVERLIAGGVVRAEHAERAPVELRGELR